ncbi:DUF3592 domain-containing protein [Hymenobacter setariae]|uniref:DUF3592 domain-containing protein n=1 Tax=Hymenobacter setariae TaxID=2594794 RepID=A0A558C4D8_9BACT|nr:DUF3592 domain-containing protein [Hymenobacter setariae]TVT43655.1 DUF3592 domain-containing protein [Hymenobacter setariae]
MLTPRPVSFTTFWSLLRERGPFGMLGLIFTLSSVLILLPMLLFMMATLRQPYERYDYAAIVRDGTAATAHVTDMQLLTNVQINGKSPELITYKYSAGGQTYTDQFATFDATELAVGSAVGIRARNGESVIPELKQFVFPFGWFFLLPGVFLLLGAIFLLIGLLPALRKYRLYRHGRMQEATVQGITSRPVRLSRSSIMQSFAVSYEYTGLNQARLLGEDRTNDILLVNEKKLGDKVQILVSETDDTQSCLFPRLGAVKNNWQA